MLNGNSKVRKSIAVLTLALGAFTSPVFAGEVTDCYWEVMEACDDALEESNWIQKIAVGAMCSGLLAGCGFEAL